MKREEVTPWEVEVLKKEEGRNGNPAGEINGISELVARLVQNTDIGGSQAQVKTANREY